MANKQLVVVLLVVVAVCCCCKGSARNSQFAGCTRKLQVAVVVVAACSLINYGLSPVFACRSKLKLDVALYHAPSPSHCPPLPPPTVCPIVRSEPVVCVAASATALVASLQVPR